MDEITIAEYKKMHGLQPEPQQQEVWTVEQYNEYIAKKGSNQGSGSGGILPTERIETLMKYAGIPTPVQEHRFKHDRKWAFDYAWLDQMVACEVEGGIWMQTSSGFSKGHANPTRFESDCEKYSWAAVLGWCVIRVTTNMIKDGTAIMLIKAALKID